MSHLNLIEPVPKMPGNSRSFLMLYITGCNAMKWSSHSLLLFTSKRN